MTSKPVAHVKPVVGKDGKTRLVKVRPFMSGAKARKAARAAKAWSEKGKEAGMSGENDAKCAVIVLNGKIVLMISGLEIGGTRIDLSPEEAEKLGRGLVNAAANEKSKTPAG